MGCPEDCGRGTGGSHRRGASFRAVPFRHRAPCVPFQARRGTSAGHVPPGRMSGEQDHDGVRGGEELVRTQGLQQLRPCGEDAVVGAEELVGGADEEVRAEVFHVDRGVRGVVHAVDVEQRPGVVHEAGYLRERRPGADQVGGSGDGDQARAVGQHGADVVGGQLTGRRVEVRPPDGGAGPLGGPDPGADVGVVVEAGDDHLVPGRPRRGEGAGEVVDELGGAAPEDDAGRLRAQQVRHGPAGLDDDGVRVALAGQQLSAVRQRAGECVGDGLDDGQRRLGAAGAVEVRGTGGEGGELRADRTDVVRHERLLGGVGAPRGKLTPPPRECQQCSVIRS